MDSYFRECHQEFYLMSIPTASIERVFPPRLRDRFQVVFNFSCQHKYQNWILGQDSTELEFLDEVESPVVIKSIQCNPEKSTEYPNLKLMRDRVFKGLEDFSLPLMLFERYELAKAISDAAWDIIVHQLMAPHCGDNLNIDLSFAVVHEHIYDENLVMNRVTQQSMQQVLEHAMVPATDASIKSLKSKTIDSNSDENHGSCSVCLEDFEAGCEGVDMPCSHIFHKDCIGKWLQASHYCPICRYEMPTK